MESCANFQMALGPTEGHGCRGGCGGRMHGICGEVEDPDGDNEMYRICHSCATKKKAQTSPPLSNPTKRKKVEGGFPAPRTRKKSTPAAAARGARTGLNFGQKLEVLKLLDQEVAHPEIARRFNCGTTAIGTIRKNRATLLADAAASSRSASSMSSKGGDFPKVDEVVSEFVEEARKVRLPITRATIISFGVAAKKRMSAAESTTDGEKKRLEDFTANEKWAKNFIGRKGMARTVLYGEAPGLAVL